MIKNTQEIILNKWINFYYKLNVQIITNIQILNALDSLFKSFSNIPKESIILIQFKIKIENNQFRSISYLQSIKNNQSNDLKEVLTEFWNLFLEKKIILH
jgi:hypothetical protein